MNNAPSVTQVAGFLEEFRETVQEFARREDELEREFRVRLDAAEKRRRKQAEGAQEEQARATAEEQSRFTGAKQRLEQRLEARNTRIARAHASARNKESERIEAEEGRRKYAVQKATLETQRKHDDQIARSNALRSDFEQRLQKEQQALDALHFEAWKAFRGYGVFRKRLGIEAGRQDHSAQHDQLLEKLQQTLARTREELTAFKRLWMAGFFRNVPFWVGAVLIVVCAIAFPYFFETARWGITREQGWIGGSIALAVLTAAYFAGRWRAAPLARKISGDLAQARSLVEQTGEAIRADHARGIEGIKGETHARNEELQREWTATLQEASEARELAPKVLETKRRRAVERNQRQHDRRVAELEQEHLRRMAALDARLAVPPGATPSPGEVEAIKAEQQDAFELLEREWSSVMAKFSAAIRGANEKAAADFPEWDPAHFEKWVAPAAALGRARFGKVEVEMKKFTENPPHAPEMASQLPQTISLPLLLSFPTEGSLLFETSEAAESRVAPALNSLILRLLSTFPAGKLNFTLIDPVKLGENFAGILHLADYEQDLISGRIWTQPGQIEEQLRELNEHIEKVIQMYLRNEYENIAEYNAQAGNIAEKYRFLIIADFPHNFSDSAVRTLLRIISSGPRCGVYTCMHWDQRHHAPQSFLPDEFRKQSICLHWTGDHFALARPLLNRAVVRLDAPPEASFATDFLHRIGRSHVGAGRVTVPFAQVAPRPEQLWSLQIAEELRVPLGRSGATKLQYLALGKGTRQHVLIAGKTGSGKSTLLHVLITNLALWCSPEEVEFYLVDFKRGVEFKDYATHALPHARVVAIESDREFGLSVLQRVDEELKKRGDLFREAGVQDISSYRKAPHARLMPRSLLIIDEFQEFFVEDDRISQSAAVLLDRIVRQGRAFGIHVVLGSQTLGGAYTLARSTMGQMVVRIALQCNEADSYLIMDESNPAPRLLSRPGEGIYNDMTGNIEGNSPFQTVWLSPEERAHALEQVQRRARAEARDFPAPVVFEGNTPADIRENRSLRELLESGAPSTQAPRIWLGAPNSIKGPTEAVFHHRSGSNLLVVGQREEAAFAMVAVGLFTLNAQLAPNGPSLILFTPAMPGSREHALLEQMISAVPHPPRMAHPGDFEAVLNELSNELQQRIDKPAAESAPIFLFVHELQHFRKLKPEDEFSYGLEESGPNPAGQLNKLISEGPALGIHVIVTLDTANNVNRFLGRKGLTEFDLRVVFQMSAQDSAALCDDPKASGLGLHRALLYNEQQGTLETFRPYALPPADWWIDNLGSRRG